MPSHYNEIIPAGTGDCSDLHLQEALSHEKDSWYNKEEDCA
jgi:hypothetical protein